MEIYEHGNIILFALVAGDRRERSVIARTITVQSMLPVCCSLCLFGLIIWRIDDGLLFFLGREDCLAGDLYSTINGSDPESGSAPAPVPNTSDVCISCTL